ncbi:MAG: DUF5906 domain-containing protein, partial [Planctomycetota bacterium]
NNFSITRKSEITFQPEKTLVHSNQFNMFDKFAIDKKDALLYSKQNIDPFINHIKEIWCKNDKIKTDYVLNWFAWCLQKPSTKTKVALVLQSSEGAGKGVIIDKFLKIFGDYYLHITDYTKIIGSFNSSLENRLLCFLDEGVWGGQKQQIGKLKTFISEDTLIINKKNVPEYVTDNRINMIIATNEDYVIPAGKTPSGSQTTETKKYFNDILKINSGAIAYYFYNRDISNYNPRTIPKSECLQGQQTLNLDSTENFILQICKDGFYNEPDSKKWMSKNKVYQMYIKFNEKLRTHICNQSTFWRKVNKIFPYITETLNKRQRVHEKTKIRQIQFYDAKDNQQYFKKYMGGSWIFEDEGENIIHQADDIDSDSDYQR